VPPFFSPNAITKNLDFHNAIRLPSVTTYQLAKDFEKNQKLSIMFKLTQKKVNVNVVVIEEHKTFNGVKGVELRFRRDFMFYLVLAKSLKDCKGHCCLLFLKSF
jgi:hypothetical protein